ncbi:MAG TPA: hypothetical protein VGG89_00625 [Candidatus Baltobacteraceae bacterium]|jgi:hypothetical protein
MLTPPLTAEQIFLRAQAAWTSRAQPAYVAFTLPCDATFLSPSCAPDAHLLFIVRMSDGRTYAQTIAEPGASPKILVRGAYITGPAGAPLGFVRRLPEGTPVASPPPNLAPDPLRTIATVTAIDYAYRVRIVGQETIHGVATTHLELTPLREPTLYPLRDLWVASDSYEIVRLVYERPFQRTTARITYDFAQVGVSRAWTIVHIAASTPRESVSETLNDISFPGSEPDSLFEDSGP